MLCLPKCFVVIVSSLYFKIVVRSTRTITVFNGEALEIAFRSGNTQGFQGNDIQNATTHLSNTTRLYLYKLAWWYSG